MLVRLYDSPTPLNYIIHLKTSFGVSSQLSLMDPIHHRSTAKLSPRENQLKFLDLIYPLFYT